MRGIEAALKVLTSESKGRFSSEALRILADREKMKAPDITLASSLIYIVMRRKELWERIADDYIRSKENLPVPVYMAVIMGTGGLLELRRFSGGVLVNGIAEYLKHNKNLAKYTGLVNAVLHKVIENGPDILENFRRSPSVEGRAMWAGVPVWSLPAWSKTWRRNELYEIFELSEIPSYSSLRVTPEKLGELSKMLDEKKIRYTHSDIISSSLRLSESVLPSNVPGFNEGLCTVQNESSILAASIISRFYTDGLILDMCSGRGVKSGQMLQECPSSHAECWEISEGRSNSALRELQRLGVIERAALKTGSALILEPDDTPSFVVLDAPCSGSGTWTRKPESKWRLDWKKFDALVETQKKLLERAVNLCKSGGYILYITCSLLKQENENVTAEILSRHSDCTEVSGLIDYGKKCGAFRAGRPYGFYIWPCNSWLDGFYCSLILKK